MRRNANPTPYLTPGPGCWCDSCQGEVPDDCVTVGEPEHFDTRTAQLCRQCLVDALAMLDAKRAMKPTP